MPAYLPMPFGMPTPRVPTPIKLYGQVVLGGRRDEITNKDFSPEELASIQQLTHAAGMVSPAKATGESLPATPGAVQYGTYRKQDADVPEQNWSKSLPNSAGAAVGPVGLLDPQGRIANSLGQFTYSRDPNNVLHVRDQYNFNSPEVARQGGDPWAMQQTRNTSNAAIRTHQALNPYGWMHYLGEKMVPEGQGPKVHLQFPPLAPDDPAGLAPAPSKTALDRAQATMQRVATRLGINTANRGNPNE